MTIRLRLTLWYMALLGAALILFSVAVYSALATTLRLQLEQNVALQAHDVARVLTPKLQLDVSVFPPDLEEILFPDVNLFINSSGVQLVNLEGEIIKRSVNLGNIELPDYEQALPANKNGEDYLFYTTSPNGSTFVVYSVPVLKNDAVVGAVQVIQPVTAAATALNQVGRYLLLGTALSLIVAAIVGAFLARRALAPIDTITNTAGAITRTHDLGKRIAIADNAREVGRLAATFNEMLDRIQQLFQTQERLIGDVSHELRTPLTTVQGNIDLLQRIAASPGPDSIQRANDINALLNETLAEVKAETERMSRMISDLLLLAQADSGGLQLQWASVEMDTVLLDVYRQARRLADLYKGAGQLEIRLGSEDQAQVRGDREKLRQALMNLVENAIKYTPSGGFVTLGLEVVDGWVKISVKDTGIGISEEQQQRIFERFYRTDKARSREMGGSGLGLSIVQSITQMHGGKITVESKLGDGSTFTLWLPELKTEE
ncbi:MAG: HAMP domain-containing histidine kinase [Anaerolineales bacterium]|nr:HAMP domain-containing histidine kinase [Anaerolineales bacterium]